jgi:hypothetical protein
MKALRPLEFRQQIIPHLQNLIYSDENTQTFSSMIESAVNEAMSSIRKHSNSTGEFDKVLEILDRVGGRRLYEIIKDEFIYDKSDEWNVVSHGKLKMKMLELLRIIHYPFYIQFPQVIFGSITCCF